MAEPIAPLQADLESDAAQEDINSSKVTIADYCAKGTAAFAQKNYSEAVDYYAKASELQAEVNGEMDTQNADILFLYGRTLFKIGQSKSDVLGGSSGIGKKKKKSNGAGKEPKPASKADPIPAATDSKSDPEMITEEDVTIVAEQKQEDGALEPEIKVDEKKLLFQFTGDENFEDSDDEENAKSETAQGEEDGEEEVDDLASAFEILDLARVLFTRRLEEPLEPEGNGKAAGDSPLTKHIKERMADTHDLLAEICLENERFPAAVSDFRSSLIYKDQLYPEESEIIAEAHYKLSLALEFASITRPKEDEEAVDSKTKEGSEAQFDQGMRDEAARELETAIKSTKLKLNNKEVELASTHSVDDNDITRVAIADVKELISDMEARLKDLQGPPVDVQSALYGSAGVAAPTGGILAATLGESPADAASRIEEAKKNATDLSGMVRRKVKADNEVNLPKEDAERAGSKRKADGEIEDDIAKKAKVEDAQKD